MQNKCIQFCLRLDKMQHISLAEFRSINWLPTKERVHQCINAINFKFVNKNYPFYLNEIFEFTPNCRIDTRNSFAKLKHPFRKTNRGQKTLSYIDPSLWNNPPGTIKKANHLNTFKQCKKSLSKPVNRYYYHYDYLGLLLYFHYYYYYYYPQYYFTILFLTNPG